MSQRSAIPFVRRAPLALALALACSATAWAGGRFDATASAASAAPLATDRMIVKYRSMAGAASTALPDAATLNAASAAAGRMGVRTQVLRRTAQGSHVLRLDRALDPAEAEQLARDMKAADPNIEYAEPDRILRATLVPNDTQYGSQWHYFEAVAGLNLPPAWDKTTGTGVVVAVIDTGIRAHADLAANLVAGYDFIGDTFVSNDGNGRDADPSDPGDATAAGECAVGEPASPSSWHGTHVAGTIAAATNNGTGVAGVAFGARVQPVRVLGKCGGYTSDIADAMVWASGGSVPGVPANATPARVLNLSLGGSGACDTTSQNAINSARSRGTVVVVAAGNSATNAANFSPASCSGVITVAAVNRSGGRAYYSNFGTAVDVAAPGGDMRSRAADGILSTLNAGTSAPGADNYAYYQGTSMASPHVAGVVALMLARNPALTPTDLETRLKTAVRAFPQSCSGCGTGIVDANLAADAAVGTAPPPPADTPVAEVEPNNSRTAAQLVSPNPARVSGTIGSTSDTDYFRVSLAAGKSLTATLTPNANADYDLYVYNSGGTRVGSSVNGTGQVDTFTVRNSGAVAATYYVRVLYFSGTTGAAGTYTLRLAQ